MTAWLLLLGACAIPTSASAQAGGFSELLAACFAAQSARTPFLGIVAAERGAESFVQTQGSIGANGSPTADIPYRLASVGKLFTQAAIGRLVDQRRISLNAPIGTYLRGLPPALAAVTVEQLVHHRSGVAPLHFMTPDFIAVRQGARTASDLLPLVVDQPLAFAPGSQVQYSNGGYFVLGAVIEAVTGKNYGDYLRDEIFRPLGMTASGLVAGESTPAAMSRMTEPGAPPLDAHAPMRGFPELPGTPAGDSVSSAEDLLRLGRALAGGAFISDATKASLFPKKGQIWRIGQGGGRPGANTWFMVWPDSKAVLVVLTNYDPPAGELMGEVLGGVLAGQPCHSLAEADRPSPMRIMRQPPPGPAPQQPGN